MPIVFVAMIALCLVTVPAASTPAGVIAGRVIDAGTRAPVAGATVRIALVRDGYKSWQVTSGPSGAFRFDGLPAEQLDVSATLEGYVGGAFGKRRPRGEGIFLTLGEFERREDVTILLFKTASVSGRIVDEHGQPLAGVPVHAWPREREFFGGYMPSTDTRPDGTYRISDITPGAYVVVAPIQHTTLRQVDPRASPCAVMAPTAPPRPLERPVGTLYAALPYGLSQPPPAQDGTPLTYRTTYFPGNTNPREAEVLQLSSGETRSQIDFDLRPVRSTTVRGRLVSHRGLAFGAEVNLRLGAESHRDHYEAQSFAGADGTFTLLDVPVGSYVLQPARYAAAGSCDVTIFDYAGHLTRQPIEVPPEGIDNVVVLLTDGVSATGSIALQGSSKPPSNVYLEWYSLERFRDLPVSGDGPVGNAFEMPGLLPGVYELQASDGARQQVWWLESVMAGGREVGGMPLTVAATGLSGIVVTLTDRPATLSGNVVTFTGQPAADATVVLFPVDRSSWDTARLGALRFQTNRILDGSFRFASVLPGEYFVTAVDEATMDDWPATSFLARTSARASRVVVARGASSRVTVTLR